MLVHYAVIEMGCFDEYLDAAPYSKKMWRNGIIDVVPDEFTWTVNWLHYLNYEAVTCISSTHHYFVLGTSLERIKRLYIKCGFLCTEHLFIITINWLEYQ